MVGYFPVLTTLKNLSYLLLKNLIINTWTVLPGLYKINTDLGFLVSVFCKLVDSRVISVLDCDGYDT